MKNNTSGNIIDLEKLLQKTIQGGNYVKVKKLSKLTALVLIFSLIVGFIMPQSYRAETKSGASIEEAIPLKAVGSINSTFNEPGVHWYQISPADVNKFSHMHLAVDSDQMVYVTVYANKENAKKILPMTNIGQVLTQNPIHRLRSFISHMHGQVHTTLKLSIMDTTKIWKK